VRKVANDKPAQACAQPGVKPASMKNQLFVVKKKNFFIERFKKSF